MYVHPIDYAELRKHAAAVEAKYPIKILGVLPRGSVGHLLAVTGVDLLAEMRPGLSLLTLAGAEIELGELIQRPVGIVLVGGLRGDYGDRVKASVRPF